MSAPHEIQAFLTELEINPADYAVFYWDVDRVIEIYKEIRYNDAVTRPMTKEEAREVIAKLQDLDISLGISEDDVIDLINEVIGK